ncbi:PcfJ domain-containing protein [Veillonella caviae]|uniref:PcfJ domain-containing protein n=1 Tax=Veillonella caviae TaxID=248316 RepID=UPI000F8C6A0C|nr:PcfJ domain-containing protein [Veillonella caviae]
MEILASVHIPKMFESIILESRYSADYTTIYHDSCGMVFGGKWERKYNGWNGYFTAAKHYVCPKCGRYSDTYVDAIYRYDDEEAIVPTSLVMDVVSFKNYLDLRVRYTGIELYYDGTAKKIKNVKQVLRFDFKRKRCLLIDSIEGKKVLTHHDIDDGAPLPILTVFGDSIAMMRCNKKAINHLYKVFRLEFVKRCSELYGFDVKDTYISHSSVGRQGYGGTMLCNLICKLIAPDMPNIVTLAKSANRWISYLASIDCVPDDVFNLTKTGVSFIDALCAVYLAPNNRKLRRVMISDPMIVTTSSFIRKFKDVNAVNTLLDDFVKRPDRAFMLKDYRYINEVLDILFSKFQEMQIAKFLIKEDITSIRDIIVMVHELKPENVKKLQEMRFKLKNFHDVVMEIHDKQEFGHIQLPVVQTLNADVKGMHFITPTTAFDLKHIGRKLNNCVGSYTKRVLDNESAIVVVTDDSMNPVACLELRNTSIGANPKFNKLVQARMFGNTPTWKNENVNSAVLTWAKQLKIKPTTIDVEAQVS